MLLNPVVYAEGAGGKEPVFETISAATLSNNTFSFTTAQEIDQLLGASLVFAPSGSQNVVSFPYINGSYTQFLCTVGVTESTAGYVTPTISGKTVSGSVPKFVPFTGTFTRGSVCYIPK